MRFLQFLLLSFALLVSKAAASSLRGLQQASTMNITVVNMAGINSLCSDETIPVSLFFNSYQDGSPTPPYVPYQYNMTEGESVNWLLLQNQWVGIQFGIQVNDWYWRQIPNNITGQMADNTGGQVQITTLNQCDFTWSAPNMIGSPLTNNTVSVTASPDIYGTCVFTIERLPSPLICPTINCMSCSAEEFADTNCDGMYGQNSTC
jgi:hypothetical protein